MNTSQVLEKEVIDSKGWKIGKIKDIIFDANDWKVLSIDVELEDNIAEEFKMLKHFRKAHVTVYVKYVQAISGDRVPLNISKNELFSLVAAAEKSEPGSQAATSPI